MQKMKIEEMNLLAETDWFVIEQQGKTMDRASQYRHYYCCNRPRRR